MSPSIARRTGRPIGHCYRRAIRETIQTVSNLPELYDEYDPTQGFQISGVFWVQGHADGGRLRGEYEDNLVDFIADFRAAMGLSDLPFIAAESLAGKPPGEAYSNAVARVNKRAGNAGAAAIRTKSKIDLMDTNYEPYNAAGDTTHWRHNSRAYLDVGYWAAELTLPKIATSRDHNKDRDLLQLWKEVLPTVPSDEGK